MVRETHEPTHQIISPRKAIQIISSSFKKTAQMPDHKRTDCKELKRASHRSYDLRVRDPYTEALTLGAKIALMSWSNNENLQTLLTQAERGVLECIKGQNAYFEELSAKSNVLTGNLHTLAFVGNGIARLSFEGLAIKKPNPCRQTEGRLNHSILSWGNERRIGGRILHDRGSISAVSIDLVGFGEANAIAASHQNFLKDMSKRGSLKFDEGRLLISPD